MDEVETSAAWIGSHEGLTRHQHYEEYEQVHREIENVNASKPFKKRIIISR
jgi:hypothetical protein